MNKGTRVKRAILSSVLIGCGLLVAGLATAMPSDTEGGVLFSYQAPDAGQVCLAGDFNGWNATQDAMANDGSGAWTLVLPLEEGRYEYKFVVDGTWLVDPDNPESVADPYGGNNSIINVGPDGKVVTTEALFTPAEGVPLVTDDNEGHLFRYHSPSAGQVNLAGTFNDWNDSANPMQNDGEGNWTLIMALDAGSYEYKFVVDGNWLVDPDNPETVADPYGGNNSVVTIGAGGTAVPPVISTTVTAPAAGTGDGEGHVFTYSSPTAAKVSLAGTFNEWSDSANPMVNDGEGNWTLAMDLGPGLHEYKFVVDGSWLADPYNPDTVSDPYGGVNSAVTIGPDGKQVAAEPTASPREIRLPTSWNPRMFLDGRYLSRYDFVKNQDNDPRFRLQRPYQSIDLNFNTEVSNFVDAFMRLRLDNRESTEVNSIAASLNEGAIDIHPGPMQVVGYWDQERLQLGDPLNLGGDRDLPGTLFDDHLSAGKGTSGVTVTGDPFGFHFQGFFADVFDSDIYNHEFLYDNSGRDYFGARLSRSWGDLDIGVPVYLQRDLFDYLADNFNKLDITAYEAYEASRDENSDFFHYEDRDFQLGLDLTHRLMDKKLTASLELLYGDRWQGIMRGNKAGDNETDGTLDVPFLTRSRRIVHMSFDYDLGDDRQLNLEHTYINENGGAEDENMMSVYYRPERDDRVLQEEEDDKLANGRVWLWSNAAPPEVVTHYTELSYTAGESGRHGLWLQYRGTDADFEPIGTTTYLDTTSTSATSSMTTLSGRTGYGEMADRFGAWDLEAALTLHDDEIFGADGSTYELILSGEREVTHELSIIGDLRLIRFSLDHKQADGSTVEWNSAYVNSYLGVRYRPNAKLEVVAAFGVDPVAYDIEYGGRHNGRWMKRNEFMEDLRFDTVYESPEAFPGASHYLYDNSNMYRNEAEKYVAELRQIGIRAIFLF